MLTRLVDGIGSLFGRSDVVWELLALVLLCFMLLMLRGMRPSVSAAVLLAIGVLGAGGLAQLDSVQGWIPRLLFGVFAAAAIIAGLMMLLQRNPIYAALCFALIVISVSGLL